jgi:hypothetical protein
VNTAWAICPECGGDPATGHAADLDADPKRVIFLRAQYLGGLPRFPQPLAGELVFTQATINVTGPQDSHLLEMADVERIEVLSSLPAKVPVSGGLRAGAVVAGALTMGVSGLVLAAAVSTPDHVNRLTFAVQARSGEMNCAAIFIVDDLYPNRFRDRLTPLLEAVGVPLIEAPPGPPAVPPVAGEQE